MRHCPLTSEVMWFRDGTFLLFAKGGAGQQVPDTQPHLRMKSLHPGVCSTYLDGKVTAGHDYVDSWAEVGGWSASLATGSLTIGLVHPGLIQGVSLWLHTD